MMISSTFEEHTGAKPKYPYFGRAIGVGYIVLFRKPNSGTVVFTLPGRELYGVGHSSEDWAEKSFEPVRGIITIECN